MALGLSKNRHQGTSVFSRILLQRTAESLFMFDKRDGINKITKNKRWIWTNIVHYILYSMVCSMYTTYSLFNWRTAPQKIRRPTVLVDSWLTSSQQSADSQPTNGQQSSYCNLTVLVHSQEHRLRYFFLMEKGTATDV